MAASPAPSQQTLQNAVKLGPGQSVHYDPSRAAGKRYYAGPKVLAAPPMVSDAASGGGYGPSPAAHTTAPRTTPPPVAPPTPPVDPYGALSPSAIDSRASQIAQSQLDPQQAAIQRQADAAKVQAQADESAITGFTKATGDLEAGMAPGVTAAYNGAATEQGGLGIALGGQVGQDLATAQGAGQAFEQAQGLQGASTSSAPDLATTVGMLQGVIPGASLAAQGAAAAAWTAEQPQIAIDAGREQLDARLAQARTDQDGYAQQLITLAQQYPDLKAQALQQLNQYELDKANYRQQVVMNKNTLKNDASTRAINKQSLIDQEKINGIKTSTPKTFGSAAAGYYTINPRTGAVTQVVAPTNPKAPQPRIFGSAKTGYFTLGPNGKKTRLTNPVKDNPKGPSAPAAPGNPKGAKEVAQDRSTATTFARTLSTARKPVLATDIHQQGKYVTAPKYKKYGYPDGSTDKIGRALKTGNYADAQNQVYTKMRGDYLISIGYSKEQVMGWVNTALRLAGWTK